MKKLLARVGLLLTLAFFTLGVVGPWLAPHDPAAIDLDHENGLQGVGGSCRGVGCCRASARNLPTLQADLQVAQSPGMHLEQITTPSLPHAGPPFRTASG